MICVIFGTLRLWGADMSREVLGDGTIVYGGAAGRGVVQRLAPGVLLFTALGDFDVPLAEGPMADFDREIEEHGSLVLCLNLLERKAIASGSRKPWTEWAAKHRGKIHAHLLMRSKLVGMAISVMAMLAGGIPLTCYSELADFEEAIARLVPGMRRLPPIPARARAAV